MKDILYGGGDVEMHKSTIPYGRVNRAGAFGLRLRDATRMQLEFGSFADAFESCRDAYSYLSC